jgi:hypothetical protein
MAIHRINVDRILNLINQHYPGVQVAKNDKKEDDGYESLSFYATEVRSDFIRSAPAVVSFIVRPAGNHSFITFY